MLRNLLKTAWRNFWKHRTTGFINIAGLSVGMAAAVFIFIWVQNEMNFDAGQPDAQNIYRIKNFLAIDKNDTWVWENSPYQVGEAAKKEMPEVEALTRIKPINYEPLYLNVNGEFLPETKAAYIDENWFNVFKTEFVSGSAAAFNQHPFSLILSESKAKKYFANQDAIGKVLRIDSNDYQVQAIIKDAPSNSSFKFDILVPIAARHADARQRKNEMEWGNFYYQTFLKLIQAASLMGVGSIQNNDGYSSGSADWDGRPKDFDPAISYFNVDVDYTKLVKLNFTSGRWFLPGKADVHNAILNETAAKEFNLHKPYIGQRFISQGDTGVVVGMVKDFNYASMHAKIGPVVFKNNSDYSFNYLVKVAPNKQADAINRIEAIWKETFPGQPFTYQFLDQEFENIYQNDVRSSTLMSVFAAIAVIISCLGLFGLAAFTAEQRGKEIGIRKVLGASVTNIVSMLSRDFIILVLMAMLIASPLAWWLMSKWLQNFVYRIEMQWWIILTAGFVALLIAFVTVSFQATKAAVANPVKRLRSE